MPLYLVERTFPEGTTDCRGRGRRSAVPRSRRAERRRRRHLAALIRQRRPAL